MLGFYKDFNIAHLLSKEYETPLYDLLSISYLRL